MIDLLKEKNLNFFELLSLSAKFYKKNVKTILFIFMIVFLPLNIFLGYIYLLRENSLANVDFEILAQNILIFGISAFPKQYISYTFLYMIMSYFFEPLGGMAIIYSVWQYITNDGNKVSTKKSLSCSFEKGSLFIISSIIYLFLIFIGSTIIFPGIYIFVAGYFYIYAIIIENKSIVSSIYSSFLVVKGNWFKLFSYIIIIKLIEFIFSLFFSSIIIEFIDNLFFYAILNEIFISFIRILFYCFISLFYINILFMKKK